ncbi:hypothetical protein CON39_11885 [Bacillus thuringiensis]|uniref:hypothetical protein n=1 Tax=Bacillus thuringiensis TaxID=1428 RepID=UPI000BECE429|nr:hypothetical protein [Bacillus thuringiensis]PEF30365.1 hypothetical protein CON39_11885 [Bacillus thuringiensis]
MKKRNRLFLANKAEFKKYKGLKEGQARVTGCTRVHHSYKLGSIVNIEEFDGVYILCSKLKQHKGNLHTQWIHKNDLIIRK